MNLARTTRMLMTALTVTAALCTVSIVAETTPVSAYTTIIYKGAVGQPRIGLIGDSSLSGVRWYGTFEPLKRVNFTFDAESCRRTIELSCRGREGYAPENGITVLRRLEGRMGKVVVMMTGYNDPGTKFAEAVDTIMAEAIRQRIPYVMWLTMRTADVTYVSPTYQSSSYTFRDNNRILLQKAQQYGGRLQIADWATYSADQPSWVTSDGVHLTVAGGNAVTDFIVDQSLLVLSGRTVTPPRTDESSSWTTVRRGDRGSQVAIVQNALLRKGYSLVGGADGVFGAYTEATLKRFQSDVGLPPTGVADEATAIALGVYRPAIPPPACRVSIPLRQGDDVQDVKCLDRHLYSRGFDVVVDRVFDSKTRAAVDFINYARGWTRDGVADRAVLTAIEAWKSPTGARPFCAAARTMRAGLSGADVLCLKRHLAGRGYVVNATNHFGVGVVDAVRHYQRHHGFPTVDGVAGGSLLADLGIWDPPCTVSIPLAPGDEIDAVVCLERHLAGRGQRADLGHYYGTGVTAGVRAVEAAAGLPADGVADPAMLTAVGAWLQPSGDLPSCTIGRVLRQGMRGRDVACLQDRLSGLGYDVNTRAVFGSHVVAAIRHYRRHHDITPFNGVATESVLEAIGIWESAARQGSSVPPRVPSTTTTSPATTTTTTAPPTTTTTTPPTTTPPATTTTATTPPTTTPPTTTAPTSVPPTTAVPPTTVAS